MKGIAKAWIEDGKIQCMSQVCDMRTCPRYSNCKEFYVTLERTGANEAQNFNRTVAGANE